MKIYENKIVKKIYDQYADFNNGRAFVGRFTSLTNEFNFAMLVAVFFFNIDLKEHIPEAIKWTFVVLFLVYLAGKFYLKLGLLKAEQESNAMRNPVQKEILESIREIKIKLQEAKNDKK